MNYKYRNNKNHQNIQSNQREENYQNSMLNYYRQFPNYNRGNPMPNQNYVSPYERAPNNTPNQWQNGNQNNYYDYNYNNGNNYNDYSRNPNPTQAFADQGPQPFVLNIEEAAERNNNYRQAIWTGEYLQITLMSIEVGSDIGYEVHPDHDQFIRIEDGEGLVLMGDSMDDLDFEESVYEDYAFVIPAGKWHNLINTGNVPIKLYSIYAPPEHPHGTVHPAKEDGMEDQDI